MGNYLLRCMALCCLCLIQTTMAVENNYRVGVGIYDITGPAAEVNLFGYASSDQFSTGIRDRQWSRAFVIAEPISAENRVVFVSVDQGAVFQGVTQGVLKKLKARYGDLYNDDNLIISATHTHGGAGGHSHYALYNVTAEGFVQQTYDATVEGIFQSIVRAHESLAPGRVLFNRGELWNASANRSLPAYENNVDAAQYAAIDPEMTVLRFIQGEDRDIGMISWFPVHAVSLPMTNTLLTSDNKGIAQYLFEKRMGSSYTGDDVYVAAFAQTNAGDMTPNLNLNGTGPGTTPDESNRMIGERQFDKAWELFQNATEPLQGSLAVQHRYVDMSSVAVNDQFTGQGDQTTCVAALGYAFASGTEDGRGPLFEEGKRESEIFWEGITGMVMPPTPEQEACQAPKPILLATGNVQPYPWTPDVLPVSIMKIGSLGLLAAPGEFTIMAGRRIRQTVESVAGTGLSHTVLAGYSNAYAGYVTTREEYDKQHYEGASTHFGPWTLAAYRQSFSRLAESLADPAMNPWAGEPEPVPDDLSDDQVVYYNKPVVHDQAPVFKSIGQTVQDANSAYQKGDHVQVKFWSGHPRNDLKTMVSFLKVQRYENGQWHTVARDRDLETRYTWQRIDGFWGTSHAIIDWFIPTDTPSGTYRIVHEGVYKEAWTFLMKPYQGTSKAFQVQ